MNPEIKKEWIEALRSGEYPQGMSELQSISGRFCCLGVLCDLHAKKHNNTWKEDNTRCGYQIKTYMRTKTYLPKTVHEWAGIENSEQIKLAKMNDCGETFSEIAGYIERNL